MDRQASSSPAGGSAAEERIVSLMWLLLDAGPAGRTKQYLHRNIDAYAASTSEQAFERMFTRDKDLLREIGVPVVALEARDTAFFEPEDIEPVRYRIDRDTLQLPEIGFTDAERLALVRAQALWEGSGAHGSVVRALGRLDADAGWAQALSAGSTGDGLDLGARLAGADRMLTALSAHARNQAIIAFAYRPAGGEPQWRTVRAWSLFTASGNWYLLGWDLQRRDRRTFRVTRFDSEPTAARVADTAETAPYRPADLDLSAVRRLISGDRSPARASLWLTAGRAHGLRLGATATGRRRAPDEGSDGTEQAGLREQVRDEVQVTYTRPAELAATVAAAGEAAVVPDTEPSLRAAVLRLLDGARRALDEPAPRVQLTAPRRVRHRESDRERVARIVDIVGLVNRRGAIPVTELAWRLGVSEQKVERYLDILRFCGMPERYFAGRQFEVEEQDGLVSLQQAEDLSGPLRLSAPEATALVAGLQAVAEIPGLDAEEADAAVNAREKILQAASPEARDTTGALDAEVDFGGQTELTARLHRCIRERRVLDVTYHPVNRDEVTDRQVEPLRVLTQDGHAYLQAWCRRATGTRTFRLDRIAAAEPTDEFFEPRAAPEPSGVYVPDGQGTTALLHFTHRVRDLASGYTPSGLAELPDGSLVAEVELATADHACALVARTGGEVRVLGPEPLVARVRDWVKRALDAQGQGSDTTGPVP